MRILCRYIWQKYHTKLVKKCVRCYIVCIILCLVLVQLRFLISGKIDKDHVTLKILLISRCVLQFEGSSDINKQISAVKKENATAKFICFHFQNHNIVSILNLHWIFFWILSIIVLSSWMCSICFVKIKNKNSLCITLAYVDLLLLFFFHSTFTKLMQILIIERKKKTHW